MDGRTLNTFGSPFPMVWGERPSHDDSFVGQLAESRARAEEYALSLLETNRVLQASLQEATIYARSLEEEIARLRARIRRHVSESREQTSSAGVSLPCRLGR